MRVVDGAKKELHFVLMYMLSLFHVFGYNGGDAKVQFQRDAQGHGKHVHASLITTYGNARQVRVVEQIWSQVALVFGYDGVSLSKEVHDGGRNV